MWVNSRKSGNARSEESDKLGKLINKYFYTGKLIDNITATCRNPVMNVSPIIRVTNFLNLLTGSLLKYVQQNRILSEEDYEKYILFSLIWSFGSIYEVPDR